MRSFLSSGVLGFRGLVLVAAPAATLLLGCGGDGSGGATSPDTLADAGPSPVDAAGDSAPVSADAAPSSSPLCDGSTTVRFAYEQGGGFIGPVDRLLETNGAVYWFVDGKCHYWAMSSVTGDVHEGSLSVADAAALVADLQVPQWSAWSAEPGGGCADGGQASFRALGAALTFVPCGASDAPAAMNRAVSARLATAYAAGTAVSGAVRYALFREADTGAWSAADTSRARPWPLSTNPETVVRSSSDTADLTLAAPPDADALRALRRALPSDVANAGAPVLGPATDGGSAHYRLYVRDTISLEDASGKVPLTP